MKIAYSAELSIEDGKVKYLDPRLQALADKIEPAKISPYYVEFLKEEYVSADAIVCTEDAVLELLIPDMEKIENRLGRAESESEKKVLEKSLEYIAQEKLLCASEFNTEELEILSVLAPITLKPVIITEADPDINELIEKTLKATKTIFFYTAGKKEVHAWPVDEGSDIVECAGKIHTDLARGFIRADIVGYQDFMESHNLNDAKTRGVAKLVDKDYIIQDGDVIEIRYNV